MNILVLTPDAVGSTLLQRLITVYMQFHQYDRPVINLHELTNGIHKYYNEFFGREVLGRAPQTVSNRYFQSLNDISILLQEADHYKTARLAQYHIRARKDPIEDQIPFYRYLNDNFYVIATRRHNVFEHALSWAINKITKKLNVYSASEKISTFLNLYQTSVTVDQLSLLSSLESYKDFLTWSEDHFSIGSYFYYDDHVGNIEKFIFDLPIFSSTEKISFKQVFDVDFNDWNKCHFFTSNIETIGINEPASRLELLTHSNNKIQECDFLDQGFDEKITQEYNQVKDQSWPGINSMQEFNGLPENIKTEIVQNYNLSSYNSCLALKQAVSHLPSAQLEHLKTHYTNYTAASKSFERMQQIGILPSGGHIPIKKQTLAAKRFMVKNFDQCVKTYNNWAAANSNIASPIDAEQIQLQIEKETRMWQAVNANLLT